MHGEIRSDCRKHRDGLPWRQFRQRIGHVEYLRRTIEGKLWTRRRRARHHVRVR